MTPEESNPCRIEKPRGALTFWIIYDKPTDFPDGFVLRPQFVCLRPVDAEKYGIVTEKHESGSITVASKLAWYAKDPEMLRAILPGHCVNLGRQPDDDKAIKEVWME